MTPPTPRRSRRRIGGAPAHKVRARNRIAPPIGRMQHIGFARLSKALRNVRSEHPPLTS